MLHPRCMRGVVAALATALLAFSSQPPARAQDAPPEAQAPADDNAALLARSSALSAEERERARTIFANGFSLWQAGDFAAAEIPFRRGLDIDPANAAGNYYYGDILIRRNAPEGVTFLRRAIAFGPDTNEAYRAEAALAAVTEADVRGAASRSAWIGTWRMRVSCAGGGSLTIAEQSGDLQVTGRYSYLFTSRRITGRVEGDEVLLTADGVGFSGRRVSPTQIDGTWNGCAWTAERE